MPETLHESYSSETLPQTPVTERVEKLEQKDGVVESSLKHISLVQETVTERLGLEPGSEMAVAETDRALVYMAEKSAEQGLFDTQSLAFEDAVIEGALEASGQRYTTGENPISTLERAGYDSILTEVVQHLHEHNAVLPNHVDAASIVVQEIEKVHGVMGGKTDPVQYLESTDKNREVLELSDETVLIDAKNRLFMSENERRGTEIIDSETGEVLKPNFELEIGETDKQAVLQKIQERRVALSNIESYLDADGEEPDTDELKKLLSRYLPVQSEGEGKRRAGTLVDVYATPDDIKRAIAVGERLDLNRDERHTAPSEKFGLTEDALAQRVIDFSEALIPEGTPLIHTVGKQNMQDILASGKLKPRFSVEPTGRISKKYAEGSVTTNGLHSQFVHFAEPGKINDYSRTGGAAIAVPIEDIVRVTPFHQPEAQYRDSSILGDARSERVNLQESIGKISFTAETAPAALKRRIAVLRDRFENGLIVENTQGDLNNLSYAASSEMGRAGAYEYAVDNATIFAGDDNKVTVDRDFYEKKGFRDLEWLDAHSVKAHIDSHGLRAQPRLQTRSEITLPVPEMLSKTSGNIVAYGPVAQSIVGFSEDDIGIKAVNLHKKEPSPYKQYLEDEQAAKIEERLRIDAERDKQRAGELGLNDEQYAEYKQRESEENTRAMMNGDFGSF